MRKIGIVLVLLLAFLLAPSYFPNPPASNDVTELPSDVQQWNNRGHYVEIGGYTLFYIHEQCRSEVKNSPTFVILHGFPSSSYEYHKVRKRRFSFTKSSTIIVKEVGCVPVFYNQQNATFFMIL